MKTKLIKKQNAKWIRKLFSTYSSFSFVELISRRRCAPASTPIHIIGHRRSCFYSLHSGSDTRVDRRSGVRLLWWPLCVFVLYFRSSQRDENRFSVSRRFPTPARDNRHGIHFRLSKKKSKIILLRHCRLLPLIRPASQPSQQAIKPPTNSSLSLTYRFAVSSILIRKKNKPLFLLLLCVLMWISDSLVHAQHLCLQCLLPGVQPFGPSLPLYLFLLVE